MKQGDTDYIFSIQDLGVRFESVGTIIDRVDLCVERGEKLSLIGKSGVGKSTILAALCGLVEFSGKIDFSFASHISNLAVAFQKPSLALNLSAVKNVEFVRLKSRKYSQSPEVYLEMVGLASEANLRASDFSGGMKRRLVLARALAAESELLLLDEAFQEIDFETKAMIIDNIKEWPLWDSTTVLQVSHDPFEVCGLTHNTLEIAGRPATISMRKKIDDDFTMSGISKAALKGTAFY